MNRILRKREKAKLPVKETPKFWWWTSHITERLNKKPKDTCEMMRKVTFLPERT